MADLTATVGEGSPHAAGASDPEPLWTYSDAAHWAVVPERTVRGWCNSPGGPRTVRLGRHVRIKPADFRAWVDAQYRSVA